MAADQSIDWELGNAPKQSITELLHNPRGPTLELPEVTLELPALSLTPAPPVTIPEPLDINHFESYLRRYAPLYEAYHAQKTAVTASPLPLDTVPSHYFQPDFSLASDQHLASLSSDQSLSDNPQLPHIRRQLATHKASLEHHLKCVLDDQAPAITDALKHIHSLRHAILSTAAALRETRQNAQALLPTVATPIAATHRLSQAQKNLRALKSALQSIQLVASAPSDVAVLLDAGEYAVAIDALHSAREALAHPNLARLIALAPVRARLAQSVEAIDAALRRQFRHALADSNHPILREVVGLVSRLGRLTTLHRFFMKEIKDKLSESVEGVTTVFQAAKLVKTSAESAVMLVAIIHEDREEGQFSRAQHLREAYVEFEEILAAVADRVLGASKPVSGSEFVVITPSEALTPETCFNEFKAAFKFGEEIRGFDELATELESMFDIERRSGTLRAKISERQMSFLSAFHRAHTEALTQAVRADKWQEIRVPDGAARLLSAVVDNPTKLHAESEGNNETEDIDAKKTAKEVTTTTGVFVMGPNSFKAVPCGVRYVRSMCAYTLLAEKSPSLSSEIARRGADYCRNFNSQVGKAILGALALQWAGLRSITARHLSLASRTIAMAASLAEYANRPLENALSRTQAGVILPLLQKSEKDFRDHHSQLLAKILAIMMDRLEAHEKALTSLPWDKHQEMQRFDIPSSYVVTLAKEATVLHRILWSILPKIEVFDIFQRVCAAYGTHLTEAYSVLDGGKRWIRIRVAKDVACLHQKLLALDVFKANPESCKPLTKLYNRFSKESLDQEASAAKDRSFNRQMQKKPPNSADTNGSTENESSSDRGSQRPEGCDTPQQQDESPQERRENSTEIQKNEKALETGSEAVVPDVKQESAGHEGNSIGEMVNQESNGEAVRSGAHSNTTSEDANHSVRADAGSDPKSTSPADPPEKQASSHQPEMLIDLQENGHVETDVTPSSDEPSVDYAANKGRTKVEDLLDKEVSSGTQIPDGNRKTESSYVAEGDLLNLGDDS